MGNTCRPTLLARDLKLGSLQRSMSEIVEKNRSIRPPPAGFPGSKILAAF
jgi:hypothetical protein